MSSRARKGAKAPGTGLPPSALFAINQDADTAIGTPHPHAPAHAPRGIGVRHPVSAHPAHEPVTPGAFVRKPIEEDPIGDTSIEEDDPATLALGARGVRGQRLSRARLAGLLGEKLEADEDERERALGDEEEDVQLVRLLIASRVLRRRRAKRLLIAHLLRERMESGSEEDEAEDESAGVDEDREIVRLIVGSRILRRKCARRMLLAHLLREPEEESA